MIAVSVASGVAALLVGAAIYYFKRSSEQVLRCVCNATVSCMIARSLEGQGTYTLHTVPQGSSCDRWNDSRIDRAPIAPP